MGIDKQCRVKHANSLIKAIGCRGRKFYRYEKKVAYFKLKRGHVYFVDAYTGKEIYTTETRNIPNKWSGFSNGGTLLSLAKDMANYIRCGEQIELNNIAPKYWGYDEFSAIQLKNAVREMEIIRRTK